jgi:hypothetical protein
MTTGNAYWAPLCELASRLSCWSRASINDGLDQWTTDCGMLLTLPVDGYLESSGGPIPIRYVEWVQIATVRVRGGIAGRPLEFVDIAEEILTSLKQLDRTVGAA